MSTENPLPPQDYSRIRDELIILGWGWYFEEHGEIDFTDLTDPEKCRDWKVIIDLPESVMEEHRLRGDDATDETVYGIALQRWKKHCALPHPEDNCRGRIFIQPTAQYIISQVSVTLTQGERNPEEQRAVDFLKKFGHMNHANHVFEHDPRDSRFYE